jgi:ATP-dependent 26S proteasome regulatory subunit
VSEQIGVRLGGDFTQPTRDRTYLFYGPSGTGKSLMVRALATECKAMVLDLSPYVVADNFTEKKRITELMYITFKVAKEFQPAIIVIDEIEHFFPSKTAKKKSKKGPPQAGKC